MRRIRTAALLPLITATALSLGAQTPKITPKGDPSVKDDSIYALAVDPKAFPEDQIAVLLDDGVVRYEADGRSTRTFRMVVQILKEDAVENYAEHRVGWAPGHQKLTVNWMRVVRPDEEGGYTVVSDKPTHVQDSDVPAQMGNPVYSDRKVRRMSLGGVAVGTIVDYSITTEELKPMLPGDWYESWSVSMFTPVRRSRFILDVPTSVTPRLLEKNLDFKRQETTAGGRRVYSWVRADVPKVKGEPLAADSNGIIMSLRASSPTTWERIASWYAGLAKDRYAVTPDVRAKVRQVVAEAKATTREDTIRAVHRWVAQDIRYVSLSLGMGGYQPRPPAEVLGTGFGDCKDKATIFVAALNEMGITAYPVLLNSTGVDEESLPSISQLDHAIAAVKLDKGGYVFTDLTSELTPYGSLPYGSQGEFAIVVFPDGRSETVTLPLDPATANVSELRIVGTLSPDGVFDGRVETAVRGKGQYALRSPFSTEFDSTQRANFMRAYAKSIFDGATGDSLVAFNGKDLAAEAKLSMKITGGRAAMSSGTTQILTHPFGPMTGFANLAANLEAQEKRRFPISAERVLGWETSLSEFRVTLPAGYKAKLPKSVQVSSPFGSYSSEYAQEGRELRLTRRTTGAKGTLPPEKIDELIAWLKQVGADDAKFIMIEKE
jgi:transglutaminase-like putative cysteine protease